MIDQTDLRAAISAGILTEMQAARLTGLADSRRGAREGLSAHDEPFELFRGFNEIFIVVGMIILSIGWGAITALWVGEQFGGTMGRVAAVAIAGAGILWALSEYFIRRRRMVAPAITLSVLWAGNASIGFSAWFAQPFMVAQEDFSSLPIPMALTTLAVFAFWFRFRVPFAMAMIALGSFTVAILIAAGGAGTPDNLSDLFLLSADGPFAWITLVLGLVVFAIAMLFDMSDPHRVTRRAANGFWLHLIAAPAVVNIVALSLLDSDSAAGNWILLAFLMMLAVVAIVIDRRSFLVAGVGYCVTLAFTLFGGDGGAVTVFALGFVLLLLGAFWEKLRARLLARLGPVLPLKRLPPTVGIS